MKILQITEELERFAPIAYQENYDNSGLLTGQKNWEVTGVLLSLDCIEEVIDEAIALNCNLIIAHHPIIFSGLKKLNGSNYIERTIIKAIQHNIAIYACHTNIDNVKLGVNNKIASKIGLHNLKILAPKTDILKKLAVYVPESHHTAVLNALFEAGCGNIGNYDNCSFNTNGIGTFRGNENSNPFLGQKNEISKENELKIETVFDSSKEHAVLTALLSQHPYEEVAYDIYSLSNTHSTIGSGMIGELETEMDEISFLTHLKKTFNCKSIRHTAILGKKIKKVAICGGSGRFLLKNAISSGADAFVTADFKYHEFFDADKKLLLADIGHFESEQFTPEIFYDIIQKKITTFAIHLSKINTNPINYF